MPTIDDLTHTNADAVLLLDEGSPMVKTNHLAAKQDIPPEHTLKILDLIEQLRSELASLKAGAVVVQITVFPLQGLLTATMAEIAENRHRLVHSAYIRPKSNLS